jgi:STE24 endopeptidase
MADPLRFFDAAEVERSRRYHRPRYVLLLVDLVLGLAVLAAFGFAWPGDRVDGWVRGLGWAAATALELAAVTVVGDAVQLPGSYWIGHVRERRYGFSTQTAWGWLGDRAKGLGVSLVLGAAAFVALVGLARALPRWWPAVAAPGLALLVLLLSFVAPVVLEPLFNRFRPLADEALAGDLRALAVRAGVPVRDVLVADASRRTTKHNAYVSGLGKTRRVVVYDTLLANDKPRELALIVAHELGHRRARHVQKGTALAMAGSAGFVLALWALLHWSALPEPGNPRVVPLVLLVGALLELPGLPLGAALSRRWEREADRFSIELTGDREAYVGAHLDLARSNLSDLDPPRLVYALLFSHPTAPERLAAASTA